MKKSTKSIIHYPNLQTVLTVENILKREKDITRTELKKRLPKKIMHQTLNVIIKYLEDSGKVIDHRTGIIWTYRSSEEMEKRWKNATPFTPEDFRIPNQHSIKKTRLSSNDESDPRRKESTGKTSIRANKTERAKRQKISRTTAVD